MSQHFTHNTSQAGMTTAIPTLNTIPRFAQQENFFDDVAQFWGGGLNFIPDAVILCNPDGMLVRMNLLASIWFASLNEHSDLPLEQCFAHLAPTDLDGKPLALEDIPPFRLLHEKNFALMENREVVFHLPEERELQLSICGTRLYDKQQHVSGAILVLRDLTEHLILKRKLQESEERQAQVLEAQSKVILQGVTRKALAERELEQLTRQIYLQGSLINLAHDAIIVRDPQNVILSWNKGAEVIYGWTSEETRDKVLHTLLQTRFPHSKEALDYTLEHEGYWEGRLEQTCRDGHTIMVESRQVLVHDVEGRANAILSISRDITERYQRDALMKRSFQALLSMAEILVLGLQAATENKLSLSSQTTRNRTAVQILEYACQVLQAERASIITFEPGTEIMQPVAMFGFSVEEEQRFWVDIPGRLFEESFSGQNLSLQLREGEAVFLDLQSEAYRDKAGNYHVKAALISPMHVSQNLIGVVVFNFDTLPEAFAAEVKALAETVAWLVTLSLEHVRLVVERNEGLARELALQTSRHYMQEFLSMASHELRTPLTVMQLNLQVLQRKLKRPALRDLLPVDIQDAIRNGFEENYRQIEFFQHLIDDLLDVTRIQSGKLRLKQDIHDLVPLVQTIVEHQRQIVSPREILLDLPVSSGISVFMDAMRIEQVLSNYLTNAFKYAPGEHALKVLLRMDVQNQSVRVLVEDRGPGIAPEEQERIWGRFDQIEGNSTGAKHSEGLGLGLYICKAIIEQHHGQVGVESSRGHGATFWFSLPLNTTPEPPDGSAS